MGVRGLKCFVRGVQIFFYLLCVCMCVCVCVCVCEGGGVKFSTSPSVKKNDPPLLLINDWSL